MSCRFPTPSPLLASFPLLLLPLGGSVSPSAGRSRGHGRPAHPPAVAPPLVPRARRPARPAAVGRRRGRGEAGAAGAGLGGGGSGGRSGCRWLRGAPAVRAAAGAPRGAGSRRGGRSAGAAPHPGGGRRQGDGRLGAGPLQEPVPGRRGWRRGGWIGRGAALPPPGVPAGHSQRLEAPAINGLRSS